MQPDSMISRKEKLRIVCNVSLVLQDTFIRVLVLWTPVFSPHSKLHWTSPETVGVERLSTGPWWAIQSPVVKDVHFWPKYRTKWLLFLALLQTPCDLRQVTRLSVPQPPHLQYGISVRQGDGGLISSLQSTWAYWMQGVLEVQFPSTCDLQGKSEERIALYVHPDLKHRLLKFRPKSANQDLVLQHVKLLLLPMWANRGEKWIKQHLGTKQ